MTDDVIDRIYEAALVPECWPGVLDRVSLLTGSAGGAVLTRGARHPPRWAASEIVAPALRAFATSGAWKYNQRPERWMSAGHAGFSRDVDLFTEEELRDDRRAAELRTHGLGWQLGTVIPLTSGEVVVFSLERRFADGAHDVAMRDAADPLRPHLARAGLLSARLGLERARTAVATLEAIGLPAAVTTVSGRVLVANRLLDQLQILLPAAHGRLALMDGPADEMLKEAFAGIAGGITSSRSIAVAAGEGRPAAIVHVLPLRGAAHDVFSGASTLIVATALEAAAGVPDLTLLHGLFDLSPAEARLALALASGRTLKEAATDCKIQLSTARSYLESIFRKTGTRQQSQLVALLKSVPPAGPHDR